jgi:hypothetical protein
MDDNFPFPKSESVLAIEPDNEESKYYFNFILFEFSFRLVQSEI